MAHKVEITTDTSDGEQLAHCSCGFVQNMGKVSKREALEMTKDHRPHHKNPSILKKSGFVSGLSDRRW